MLHLLSDVMLEVQENLNMSIFPQAVAWAEAKPKPQLSGWAKLDITRWRMDDFQGMFLICLWSINFNKGWMDFKVCFKSAYRGWIPDEGWMIYNVWHIFAIYIHMKCLSTTASVCVNNWINSTILLALSLHPHHSHELN